MNTTIRMSGLFLRVDNAIALNLFRQPRLRNGDAVLHQHLRLVEIGPELEGGRDA